MNWEEIQKYYDDNHTWSDMINKYKLTNYSIVQAKLKGLFISRTKSEANIIANIKKPRILSDITKNKISKSRKKYLFDNPNKVPYLLNHNSKGESYPEKYFQNILNKSGLKYDRYLQISIYNLDFAFIDKGIDLEIDGDQHILDKTIIKSNIDRDEFLTRNGWKVIRILWSKYKKMNILEKTNYINNLINYINGCDKNVPTLINNINKCECGKTIHSKSKKCIDCYKKYRKNTMPPQTYSQLMIDVNILGYSGTGRKYNVSGNTIKKWINKYSKI